MFRLASPVWVGWAILHTKTLLDVYLLSSNFANLVLKEDTATGTSISVMTIQSLRFWRGVYCISSLTWASYVAYPLSRQRRPDDGVSRSKTPTSFFVPVRLGRLRTLRLNNDTFCRQWLPTLRPMAKLNQLTRYSRIIAL